MSVDTEVKQQFITLSLLKRHFKITDTQDNDILVGIVEASNLEVTKQILPVIDNINIIEDSIFFQPAQDAALVFAESRIRREINQMYTEADMIMVQFKEMMATLIGEIRSQAPVRTSRHLASRDVDFEDDFFAERRFV